MGSKLNNAIEMIDSALDDPSNDDQCIILSRVGLMEIRNELVRFNNQLVDLLIEFQDDVLGAEEEVEAVPDAVVAEAVA